MMTGATFEGSILHDLLEILGTREKELEATSSGGQLVAWDSIVPAASYSLPRLGAGRHSAERTIDDYEIQEPSS
jgi:hypothetical protein